jgi:hypothetical protein
MAGEKPQKTGQRNGSVLVSLERRDEARLYKKTGISLVFIIMPLQNDRDRGLLDGGRFFKTGGLADHPFASVFKCARV